MASRSTSLDSFDTTLGGVSDRLTEIGTLADDVGRTLTHAFKTATSDGKSLQTVLGDIAKSFEDIVVKAALKPLDTLISGAVEGLFAATGGPASQVTPFAKGGVLAAPAYFPLQGGLGLAGEAGPEAVMPLTRGSDGRLGVAASGGAVNVTFNVTASDAKSFVRSEAEVSAMLLRAVKRGTRGS